MFWLQPNYVSWAKFLWLLSSLVAQALLCFLNLQLLTNFLLEPRLKQLVRGRKLGLCSTTKTLLNRSWVQGVEVCSSNTGVQAKGPVLTLLLSLRGFLPSSLHSRLSHLAGDMLENLSHVWKHNCLQTIVTWQKRIIPAGVESHVSLGGLSISLQLPLLSCLSIC